MQGALGQLRAAGNTVMSRPLCTKLSLCHVQFLPGHVRFVPGSVCVTSRLFREREKELRERADRMQGALGQLRAAGNTVISRPLCTRSSMCRVQFVPSLVCVTSSLYRVQYACRTDAGRPRAAARGWQNGTVYLPCDINFGRNRNTAFGDQVAVLRPEH